MKKGKKIDEAAITKALSHVKKRIIWVGKRVEKPVWEFFIQATGQALTPAEICEHLKSTVPGFPEKWETTYWWIKCRLKWWIHRE